MARLLIVGLFLAVVEASQQWTHVTYPDIRGINADQCKATIPPDQQLYICDPDQILDKAESSDLNTKLHELTMGTKCKCQRKSQCAVAEGSEDLRGFVVSIAVVKNINMKAHSPSEADLTESAESFCRALEGKWALGDCGNSIIIFVWEHYKKILIWPARLANQYVTADERKAILARVNKLAQIDDWSTALSEIIGVLHTELTGDPETRVDTGTISLIVSVGVAVILTCIITFCVCAFRCCGNLRSEDGSVAGRVDSLRNSIVRRGSSLRRSISRSPKFSTREGQQQHFFSADITSV